MPIQDAVRRIAPQWHTGGVTESLDEFDELEAELGVALPADYKYFLMEVGEGEANLPGGYLRLYPLNDILRRQEAALPKIVVFGSDGGDHCFGFDVGSRKDSANYKVVEFPTSTMDAEEAEVVADSFEALLKDRLRGSR